MSFSCRPYEPDDEHEYFAGRAATYNDGAPMEAEAKERALHSSNYAVLSDGVVIGGACVIDYVTARGAADLRMGGVGAVFVDPASRKSGAGSFLMNWLVREMRAQGQVLSSLYAFRESFYRKSGYESTGRRLTLSVPSHRLPRLSSELSVRRLAADELDSVGPCYESFIRSRSGYCVRSADHWKERVARGHIPTIYAFGDPVEAYAIVSHRVAFWEPQHLNEVAWSSEAGYKALLSWFGNLTINKSHAVWTEPSDSPYLARYLDQGAEVKMDHPIMYRVTDVAAALRQLRASSSGSFTIKVLDDLVPENVGPWRVTYAPSGVEVEPCSEASILLGIRPFTTAFLGEPHLRDLARIGLAQVDSEAAMQGAEGLLTPTPVCCAEFF